MSDELYHHGVKGQKWGIRKEYEKIQRKANRFGKAVAGEEKISSDEKKERAIAAATTSLIAGGMAYLYGKKKWLSSGTTAIATGQNKTRLLTAGMAIVGGVAGFSVAAAKQRYAKDQKFKGMDRASIKTVRSIQNNPITNPIGNVTSKIGKKVYQLERGMLHSEEDNNK